MAGGRQAWKWQGRSEEGCRVGWTVGGRERGEGGSERGKEGWREQGSKGREEAIMLGRDRALVEEGRVERGRVDEGNERGRDGAREREA